MSRKCLLLLCGAAALQSWATTCGVDSAVVNHRQIDEVAVTATRIKRAVASGKPIQVMDKAELEALGLVDMAAAVRRFAGADVKDYGGIGGMKTVSVRGLGAQHTAVSYDGVTVSNTQAGQIDIGRYSLDNVRSIALAIGDGSDMLQTARHQASASVLYIQTERPRLSPGKPYEVRARMRGGSFGWLNPSVRYWQRLADSTSLAVVADYTRADGDYPFTVMNGNERERQHRNNSDIQAWRGELNLYHHWRGGGADAKAYWFYSERGLPGSVVLYNPVANERLWDEDFFAQASMRHRWNEAWQVSACLKYAHTWNRYTDEDAKYQGGRLIEVNRQNEYYGSMALGWKPRQDLSLSLAQDAAYGDLRSNAEHPAQPRRTTSLTALTARYHPRRWEITAGLVGTYVAESVEHGDAPRDRKRLSPSLSVAYRLMGEEALYLRAMMKHTFRVPTFNDLYYNQSGTVTLRPEKAREYNVGITWQSHPWKHCRYLSLTLDGYYNDVSDKIVAFPTLYVWKMANYGKVRMYGLNATLATELLMGRGVGVILTAAYTLQHSIDVTDPAASYYKNQLPYTPVHAGNAAVTVRTPWLRLGYSVTACGERYCLQQQAPAYRLAPYWEHSVTLSRSFRWKGCSLDAQVSVINLGDEQYEIVKYYPMAGRSWRMGGTFTF